MSKRVKRTRNGGKWTQSQFEAAVRSALRRKFQFWGPLQAAKKRHSRPYKGKDKRRKIEVQCQECKEWFPPSSVEVDHVNPVGTIKDKGGKMTARSLWNFLNRLTEEDPMLYRPLCKACHRGHTQKQRKEKK